VIVRRRRETEEAKDRIGQRETKNVREKRKKGQGRDKRGQR
jgi:hypothetical protein